MRTPVNYDPLEPSQSRLWTRAAARVRIRVRVCVCICIRLLLLELILRVLLAFLDSLSTFARIVETLNGARVIRVKIERLLKRGRRVRVVCQSGLSLSKLIEILFVIRPQARGLAIGARCRFILM